MVAGQAVTRVKQEVCLGRSIRAVLLIKCVIRNYRSCELCLDIFAYMYDIA